MATYMGGETSTLEKVMYWVLGIVFVAFLISVPFMLMDKQERLEKAWQDKGCQMYDMEKPQDVPAKCSKTFTDHYAPQDARLQPPSERQ